MQKYYLLNFKYFTANNYAQINISASIKINEKDKYKNVYLLACFTCKSLITLVKIWELVKCLNKKICYQ